MDARSCRRHVLSLVFPARIESGHAQAENGRGVVGHELT